jgi:hypothetical protein
MIIEEAEQKQRTGNRKEGTQNTLSTDISILKRFADAPEGSVVVDDFPWLYNGVTDLLIPKLSMLFLSNSKHDIER